MKKLKAIFELIFSGHYTLVTTGQIGGVLTVTSNMFFNDKRRAGNKVTGDALSEEALNNVKSYLRNIEEESYASAGRK